RRVAQSCAQRLARPLLELGGNNGIVVMNDANLDLAMRAIAFGAAGTAGQRCTTTRRLFVQKGVAAKLVERLTKAYKSIKIGDPLEPGTLMGPLIDAGAVAGYERAVAAAKAQGGTVVHGGKRLARPGHFVEPTLVTSDQPLPISHDETFAPILYIVEFDTLEQAVEMH